MVFFDFLIDEIDTACYISDRNIFANIAENGLTQVMITVIM